VTARSRGFERRRRRRRRMDEDGYGRWRVEADYRTEVLTYRSNS